MRMEIRWAGVNRLQGHATGARAAFGGCAVVPADAGGDVHQGMELLPVSVRAMGADRDAHAGDLHTSLVGFATGKWTIATRGKTLRMDAHERWVMDDLSIPGVAALKV